MQILSEKTISVSGFVNLSYRDEKSLKKDITGLYFMNGAGERVFVSLKLMTKEMDFYSFIKVYDVEAIYLVDEQSLVLTADPGFERQLLLLVDTEKEAYLQNDLMVRKMLGLHVQAYSRDNVHIATVIPKLKMQSLSNEFSGLDLRKSQELFSKKPQDRLKRQYQLSIALLNLLCKMHESKIVFRVIKADDLKVSHDQDNIVLVALHYLHAWKIENNPFVSQLEHDSSTVPSVLQFEAACLSALLCKIWGLPGFSPASSPEMGSRKSYSKSDLKNSGIGLYKSVEFCDLTILLEPWNIQHANTEDFVQALSAGLQSCSEESYLEGCALMLSIFKKRFSLRVSAEVKPQEPDETTDLLDHEHEHRSCCSIS